MLRGLSSLLAAAAASRTSSYRCLSSLGTREHHAEDVLENQSSRAAGTASLGPLSHVHTMHGDRPALLPDHESSVIVSSHQQRLWSSLAVASYNTASHTQSLSTSGEGRSSLSSDLDGVPQRRHESHECHSSAPQDDRAVHGLVGPLDREIVRSQAIGLLHSAESSLESKSNAIQPSLSSVQPIVGVTTLQSGSGFKKTFFKRHLPSPPATAFSSPQGVVLWFGQGHGDHGDHLIKPCVFQ